jgi:hypothetical protein
MQVPIRRVPTAAPMPMDPSLLPPQDPPNTQPAPVSPQIIYINNVIPPPSSAMTPQVPMGMATPAAAAPPAPIHHHHYNNETTHRVVYRIPATSSNSALGMAALALGVIACVICWVPWLGLAAVPIGTIGALLGLLGWLVSLTFKKSSPGLPFAAIFICCVAAGISIYSTKTLPFWRNQLNKVLSDVLPHGITLPQAVTPATAPPIPPPPLPALPSLSGLIGTSTPPAPASPAPTVPSVTPQHPAGSATPPNSPMNATVAGAFSQLEAAEKACDQQTMQTPAYQAALKAVADARARAATLRENAPASAALRQASQELIDNGNALTELLQKAEAADPSVIAAEQNLSAAKAAAH